MLKADAAGGDVGLEVVFTFDGGVGKAAEHGDLADVIEGVSNRALEETLGGAAERFAGGQVVIKLSDGSVKTIHLGVPWQRGGVVPGLLALSDGEGPVEEIAQVREDLRGRARFVSDVEAGEMFRGAAQSFATAVGDGGDGVAKELPSSISIAGH